MNMAEGNTILQQKAQKAAQLHAELNVLLEKQAQRRADEINQPFGSSFIQFIKKSKSEIINISAAFTCVILAWQIATMRASARKLLNLSEEREAKVEELKGLLRIVTSNDFQSDVSKRYMEKKNKVRTTKSRFPWMNKDNTDALQDDEELLSSTLEICLEEVIKDAALSDVEIEEKKLKDFQKEMGVFELRKGLGLASSGKDDNDVVALMNQIPLKEENVEENSTISAMDNRNVVKRSKGFI